MLEPIVGYGVFPVLEQGQPVRPCNLQFIQIGFGGNVNCSNLAKVNECREHKIFEDFSNHLISLAREKRVEEEFFIDGDVDAFDSSSIKNACAFSGVPSSGQQSPA